MILYVIKLLWTWIDFTVIIFTQLSDVKLKLDDFNDEPLNPKILKHVDDDENIKLYVECVNFNLFDVVL